MARKPHLEEAVMNALWGDVGPLTPADVRAKIKAEHDVAYTTVMTVLVRLWQKGRLDRSRDGRSYRYRPVESREEFESRRMAEILRSVDDEELTLARFVARLTPAEKSWIRRHMGRS